MKKRETRFHKNISNMVASVYIDRYDCNVPFKSYNGSRVFDIHGVTKYDYLSVCVSKSRRLNNDWYNGDKKGSVLDNKATGNIATIMAIVTMLEDYIVKQIENTHEYCLMYNPTDSKRDNLYRKTVEHICKKYGYKSRCIEVEERWCYVWYLTDDINLLVDRTHAK